MAKHDFGIDNFRFIRGFSVLRENRNLKIVHRIQLRETIISEMTKIKFPRILEFYSELIRKHAC